MSSTTSASTAADAGTGAIVSLGARALSQAIQARHFSCVEVMHAYLAQISSVNPTVNAIVALDEPERLLAKARAADAALAAGQSCGVFHGIPQAPKDLAAVKDMVTTLGSPLFANHRPAADAIFVERLRAAGAIFVGRTNAAEFGLGSHTYNPVYGLTRNPWDPSKSAGGSSGGAGAAVASRMLPCADGSDMMGSLRNPAAFNNVVGFRPSFGAVPYGPTADLFLTQLPTDGPIARSVDDMEWMLQVIGGPDMRVPLSGSVPSNLFQAPSRPALKNARIGWLGNYGGYLPLEEGMLECCERALKPLQDLGHQVAEATLPMPPDALWQMWLVLRHMHAFSSLKVFYDDPARRNFLKPEAQWEVEQGALLRATEIARAFSARSDWYRNFSAMFDEFDFLVLPSTQVFPFEAEKPWPERVGGVAMDTYHRWQENMLPATLAGAPAISVPAGFHASGLPFGLQLIAKPQNDRLLLALARQYELCTRHAENSPTWPVSP